MKYRYLEHTADIKIQAFGKTLNQAFQNSALAITNYISKGEKIKSKLTKEISLKGTDQKSLLYKFLDEILYLFDAESFLTASAKIKIKENTLTAELKGDSSENYKDLDHIKAATYAEMHIKKSKGFYEIQFVVDV